MIVALLVLFASLHLYLNNSESDAAINFLTLSNNYCCTLSDYASSLQHLDRLLIKSVNGAVFKNFLFKLLLSLHKEVRIAVRIAPIMSSLAQCFFLISTAD